MIVEIKLNGKIINDPNNLGELTLSLNNDKDNPGAQVNLTNWELGVGDRTKQNDGAVLALNYRLDGLSKGYGVFEGIPLEVSIGNPNERYTPFKGMLDLRKAEYFCDKVIAPPIEELGIDWLNENAEFTFEYLAALGIITQADYIPVPYVISTIPDAQNGIITILGLFVVANEIKDQIQSLLEYVSAASNPFTANIIIAVILRVVYIIILLIAIIKFLKDLFNLIIQPVKYHMGMYQLTLCQKACEYLGIKFKSSILETSPFNECAIIPEKYSQNVNDDGILGFLKSNSNEQVGYYKGTFGKLLRELKLKYKAKIIMQDGYLMLEREDFVVSNNNYILPDVELLSHTLNYEDFTSNYVLSFATDMNDKNTIQQYLGTIIQVQTVPVKVGDRKRLLLSGLTQVEIPYALTKVKTDLTLPEKIFDAFFKAIGAVVGAIIKVINKLIKLINKLIDLVNKIIKALATIGIKLKFELKKLKPIKDPGISNLISSRIGMMILENDFISVPKVLLVKKNGDAKNNKPLPTNGAVLNALSLYRLFHFIQSFVPSPGKKTGNQMLVYPPVEVPLTFEDYKKIKRSFELKTADGTEGVIYSCEWNLEKLTAQIGFKVRQLYTKNLKEIISIPNGR